MQQRLKDSVAMGNTPRFLSAADVVHDMPDLEKELARQEVDDESDDNAVDAAAPSKQ